MKKIAIALGVLIFISIIFSYIYWGIPSSRRLAKQDYSEFYSSEIVGKIDYIGYAHKEIAIKINGGEQRYIFHPRTGEINDFIVFETFASVGDSVNKPTHIDTLKLIKKGVVYRFPFGKPDE